MGVRTLHLVEISIHAPTRGATIAGRMQRPNGKDFNPRSHEGSDPDTSNMSDKEKISIHAPTRGATEMKTIYDLVTSISIHAPTRGATEMPISTLS